MNKWQAFIEKLKSPQGKKILVLSVLTLIVIGFVGYVVYARYLKTDKPTENKPEDVNIQVKESPKEEKVASKLDGVDYNKDIANRHPIAVMIENHPEARPQIGLDKASIIYEAEAEGGITRFMAIYGAQDAEKAGPVRSARTYYVDWALEYDAFYAHVGGSADGLALISQVGIKDLNQFNYGTRAFWREAENKAIEHTMYTNTNKLRDIAKDNGWETSTSDFTSLSFKDDASLDQRGDINKINVAFSGPLYSTSWAYDKENNIYKRSMAGAEHKDRISGQQLTAKNIIVQEVPRTLITNDGGKQVWQLSTIGEGNAKIYLDGKKIDAKWKKSSRGERTKFYDTDEKEIQFNKGVTWYEEIAIGGVVTEE